MVLVWLSMMALLLALAGCLYLAVAAASVARCARPRGAPVPGIAPNVTLLKPLHGAEAGLYENLLSFCRQDYAGAMQVVFGVANARDPAVEVIEHLRRTLPAQDIDLVVDPTLHGTNRKVSNLINMAARSRHDVLVLADSDIRVGPHYLARVVAALGEPGIGLVTCLYRGSALDGLGSRLLALGINAHFLPNACVGLFLGLARPCFGSTIAIRRETLVRIGGFEVFADSLADDYALGAAVRSMGCVVAIPPFAVVHVSGPMTARELWRHELRWARTIRVIDPWGHLGSFIAHPLAWSLLALLLGLGSDTVALAAGALVAAAAGRAALLHCTGKSFGFRPQSYWLVPARDLLSFAVFVASLVGRGVSWGGRRFHIQADGALQPDGDSRAS
jgi:ceramide glucosyltransferase